MLVVLGDTPVEERLIRRREGVTIGQSTKNTFSIPLEELPRQWPLFGVENGRYVLRFTEKMDGRVSDGDKVHTLASLRGREAQRRGDHFALALGETSRGKITVGDLTLLFQFVVAPPLRARPRLPASVRGTLSDRVDPRLAAILAISVLVHFSIALYAYYYDAPRQTRTDRLHQEYVEGRFEERRVELFDMPSTATTTDEGAGEDEGGEEPEPARTVPRERPDRASAGDGGALDDAGIDDAIAADPLAGVLGAGEGEQGRYSESSDLDPGAPLDLTLDHHKKSGANPTTIARGDRRTGGPRTGEVAADRGERVAGPDTGAGTGAAARKEEVVSRVGFTRGTELTDTTLDPEDVVRRIRSQYIAGIRRCHERALKTDPRIGGRVDLRFTIGAVGRITRSSVSGFDPTVDTCIKNLMANWRFAIPKEKGGKPTEAEFMIPLVLKPGGAS